MTKLVLDDVTSNCYTKLTGKFGTNHIRKRTRTPSQILDHLAIIITATTVKIIVSSYFTVLPDNNLYQNGNYKLSFGQCKRHRDKQFKKDSMQYEKRLVQQFIQSTTGIMYSR